MLSYGWRTEQSPFRTAPAERRVGTKLRRSPVKRGIVLSKGCVAARNTRLGKAKSERAMRKLLAALEKFNAK